MSTHHHSTKVSKLMQVYYDKITALTDQYCQQSLDDDYQALSRYLTGALCRKRPSPLTRGAINTWACAIVYALGTINFLFDKSTEPYVSANDLTKAFNIAQSTGQNKSKQIRDILKMRRFDHQWCLPSRLENSSFAWMITFNGFIVDARTLPLEFQEIAYEKGLIPYVDTNN